MADYSAPESAPIWFDLMSSDPEKVADFYGELFGWEVEEGDPDFGGYRNFLVNGNRVAGLMPVMDPSGPSDIWSVYLRTDDADATAKAVEAAGASIMVPPMAVGDMGTMLVTADPAGAVIGFWQAGTHPGYVEYGTHGTPYWFECQTKDYPKATEFYASLPGVRLEEIGTGGAPDAVGPEHYSQLFYGESSYGGIMDAVKVFPPEMPSFWQVYIYCDDVFASVTKAIELGGEAVMPGEVTPYGTIAAIRDPFGALICLGHPPAGM